MDSQGVSAKVPNYANYLADPFIFKAPEGFIAFGTSTMEGVKGTFIKALSSNDLVVWEELGSIVEGVPAELGVDFWAPEVVHSDNFYWIYFSVGNGISGHHIRVAKSSTPTGPYLDQGINLTPNEIFAIDAHPFLDEDGTWYLYFARDVLDTGRLGTHIAAARMKSMTELDSNTSEVLAPNSNWQIFELNREIYHRVIDWHTLEGPSVVKRFGKYFLFFSGGNWQNESYGVSYATSMNPLGPWEHVSSSKAEVLNSNDTGLIGPGHCSILNINPSFDIIVYHAWNKERSQRQLYLDKLSWVNQMPKAINVGFLSIPIVGD